MDMYWISEVAWLSIFGLADSWSPNRRPGREPASSLRLQFDGLWGVVSMAPEESRVCIRGVKSLRVLSVSLVRRSVRQGDMCSRLPANLSQLCEILSLPPHAKLPLARIGSKLADGRQTHVYALAAGFPDHSQVDRSRFGKRGRARAKSQN